ncbi:hypothetical protein GCM10029976_025310 [Kribbella albertanoniae]
MLVATGVWFLGIRHGDGPLGESGLGTTLCMPVGESESATVGIMKPLQNSGSDPVTITDVTLIGPRAVENAGALLVPEAQKDSTASRAGWTFDNGPFDGQTNRPRLAVDAVLPAKQTEETWLVVHVTRPDVNAEGYLEGIRIEYTTGVRRYVLKTGPEHILRITKCS